MRKQTQVDIVCTDLNKIWIKILLHEKSVTKVKDHVYGRRKYKILKSIGKLFETYSLMHEVSIGLVSKPNDFIIVWKYEVFGMLQISYHHDIAWEVCNTYQRLKQMNWDWDWTETGPV